MFGTSPLPGKPGAASRSHRNFGGTSWRSSRGNSMRLAVLAWALLCTFLLCPATYAVTPKGTEIIPVSQIHAGMHGVAYTVFEGTKPEPMEVEVLGILRNSNGPKGDIILVRLHGKKAHQDDVALGPVGIPQDAQYFDLHGLRFGALEHGVGDTMHATVNLADRNDFGAFGRYRVSSRTE